MLETVARRFASVMPAESACSYCALRLVEERSERIVVRQDVLEPVARDLDVGAMVTVLHGGGYGYAATSDLTESGLGAAVERARSWAARTAAISLDYGALSLPRPEGSYRSRVTDPWSALPLRDKIELVTRWSRQLRGHQAIVDWEATLWRVQHTTLFMTGGGGQLVQQVELLAPRLSVTANREAETQTRSLGSYDRSQQGGLEVLSRARMDERCAELADDVMVLLDAPNCPSDRCSLVLAPDQMMLQIHESIGHPLELDRILGDERNYAGTSFVTLDMFGHYRYGSSLLNVTFDPSRPEEHASYAYDDDGARAEKTYLIRDGLLEKPLGGTFSQARAAGLGGTANARATSWNRPPIDRMANLNVEAGSSTLGEIISGVERGVLMTTNRSWSIDDSRNKFQFGCEKGQLIRDGQLGQVVRNPNYRGISATFWRDLTAVGNAATVEVMGTPFCGKGEPNQIIRVGHAAPYCRFAAVDVFGGG